VIGRKQDFREFKQLQREEMKEATTYFNKIKAERDTQEKKFEMEVQVRHVDKDLFKFYSPPSSIPLFLGPSPPGSLTSLVPHLFDPSPP